MVIELGKKQRGIQLMLNRKFREKDFKTQENKVIPEKGDEVRYSPACVFDEEKTWSKFKFWRHPRKLIFFVEGTVEALKFNAKMKGMNPFWSKKETRDFVHKLVAKTKAEQKPMKWSQFIVIMIVLVIIVVLLLRLQGIVR